MAILEFLDTDVFDVSIENCVYFLDPLIESWDIELETFAVEIVLMLPSPAMLPRRKSSSWES